MCTLPRYLPREHHLLQGKRPQCSHVAQLPLRSAHLHSLVHWDQAISHFTPTPFTCEAWHLSTRALIYHTRWAQVQLMRPYKAAAHFLRRRGCKPIKRATTQSSSTSSSPTLRSWTLAPSVLDNTCLGGVGRCAGCLQRKSVVGTTAQGHE